MIILKIEIDDFSVLLIDKKHNVLVATDWEAQLPAKTENHGLSLHPSPNSFGEGSGVGTAREILTIELVATTPPLPLPKQAWGGVSYDSSPFHENSP